MKNILFATLLIATLPVAAYAEEATTAAPKEHHMQNANPTANTSAAPAADTAVKAPEHHMQNANPSGTAQEPSKEKKHTVRNN